MVALRNRTVDTRESHGEMVNTSLSPLHLPLYFLLLSFSIADNFRGGIRRRHIAISRSFSLYSP